MKHVFTNRELPHIWAHKSQDEGRTSNGNMFFRNGTIYSYGEHFPIAKHYTTKAGDEFILFTTRDYSVTTSGHKSRVRQAIPRSTTVLHVPCVLGCWNSEPDHAANLKALASNVEFHSAKAARARLTWSVQCELGMARDNHDTFVRYCELFKIPKKDRPKLPDVPAMDSAKLAEMKANEAAASARKAVAAKERARLRAIELAEAIGKWQSGEIHSLPWDAPAVLRIEGDEVVTSKGARVPVNHAKRGLRFVREVVASGVEYRRNGHTLHLGHYSIDRIEADGTLHAGCHVIAYAEIERIAPQLEDDGVSGQDRESYTDDQDRESYTVE